MKKLVALLVVTVSLVALASVAAAEVGNIGGLPPTIRICSHRQSAL